MRDMICRRCRALPIRGVLLALVMISLNGCSFHSKQWSAVSALWSEASGPQKNWRVSWDGDLIDVFAINTPDEVIFADGDGFLLRFDGWQITAVEGILPRGDSLNLDVIRDQEEQLTLLRYSGTNSDFGQQRCDRWMMVSSAEDDDGDVLYEQRCDSGTASATHTLRLNSDRQLLAMRFTFHPARPPAIIRYMGE